MPLKCATDFGYMINKEIAQKYVPNNRIIDSILPQSSSMNLSRLADIAIKGALGELPPT